jgi:ADP-heptose:LPS heptosyltransferase
VGADQALIATSFHQSPLPLALMLRLAGVATIAATSVDFPGTLLDVRHTVIDGHEVEQTLSLAATLGYHLPVDDDGALRLREPLPVVAPFSEPYVVVHPGASVPARGIPVDLAADVVDALVRSGWKVALSGSPGEAPLTAHLASGHGDDVVDLAGRFDLAGLAGLARDAAALVCGNTGPAHVAAAVGTPVVSVFAPVVPAHRWAPWQVPAVVLGDQSVPCAGCRARRCPLPVQSCVAGITAEVVVKAVESIGRSVGSAVS